ARLGDPRRAGTGCSRRAARRPQPSSRMRDQQRRPRMPRLGLQTVHRVLRPLVVVGVLALGLSGCAVAAPQASTPASAPAGPLVPLDELDLLEDPAAYVGESTALLRDVPLDVLPTPQQDLPATVVSHDLDG